MMAHAFNPSTWKAEAGECIEFEASGVHKANSKTASIHRETLSQNRICLKLSIHVVDDEIMSVGQKESDVVFFLSHKVLSIWDSACSQK